ncbi:hypothetical protein HN51_034262 [Arachis hypogaea]|uniref:Uncharacterized protein n=1 Tax=Arachis hypogaea TaxID=3818 RepID=A0A445A8V8_ARAHY|nr:uncharacterized protein DS421_3g64140 [Arachis hypogaea]RYR22884.1 hypothetical protein Ahy_B03g068172 [Arachis hypogaea]RYR70086.1 hypothetical protein Ahy_A03g016599 [Arachis hypogaea]
MSAMVDVWVGELTKLREKVLARSPFLTQGAKAKESSSKVVEKEQHKKEKICVQMDNSTMSEATVCLLMDRFVPW